MSRVLGTPYPLLGVWLVSGALIGMLYGGILWYSVHSVRATWPSRTLMVTWRGVVLRTTAVAALVLGLFAHSPAAGVWGLCGFLAARSLWCGWVICRTTSSPWPATYPAPPRTGLTGSGTEYQRERKEMG